VKTLHLFFQKRFATGTASPSLLVPLFAKNSRLGYFFNANNLNQNFILISKTTRDWDCFASLMIPFLAKNSRLGYFLNARNLRRFSQSKFHFDFEDDLPQGPRRLRSLSRYLLKIAV
jgi:hypothetical protein